MNVSSHLSVDSGPRSAVYSVDEVWRDSHVSVRGGPRVNRGGSNEGRGVAGNTELAVLSSVCDSWCDDGRRESWMLESDMWRRE
jgi:hypothetical protein